MSLAKINNIELYYEVHGEGRPLMLIGGLASDSQTWSLMIPHLEKCFKVIVFDNRGIGRTKDNGRNIDVSVMAKDAAALLDHLEINSADIAGHSMGGYIAQEIAVSYPRRVNRLILASTAAYTSERNISLCNDLVAIFNSPDSYEIFLKVFLPWIFSPEYLEGNGNFDGLIKYLLAYPYRQSPKDFKRQVDAYTKNLSSYPLDKITAETLVIAGDKDKLITRDETDILASRIPNARAIYLSAAAHSLPVEAPEEFAEKIYR